MENLHLPRQLTAPRYAGLIWAGIIAIMTFTSCGVGESGQHEISVDRLYNEQKAGGEMFVVDVRTEPEFVNERLEFADGQIEYDLLEKNLDGLPTDKSALIYCFCRSGRRSGIATAYLREIGYENSYNVSGGILAWKEAGYPVVSGSLKEPLSSRSPGRN